MKAKLHKKAKSLRGALDGERQALGGVQTELFCYQFELYLQNEGNFQNGGTPSW